MPHKKNKHDRNHFVSHPKTKFHKNGISYRVKPGVFSRTKATWDTFKTRHPKISSADASSDAVSRVEDAARHRAFLASRRASSQPPRQRPPGI